MARMSDIAPAVSDERPATEAAAARPTFEAFFDAEHARLLRALFLVTGNEQEAEEVMQDAFIAVWERWDRVGAMDSPAGYLYRTAMNRWRSRVRRASVVARRVVGTADAGDQFAAADERDALARALARLPERQRAAIVVTELLGFPATEAATVLGVKDATVRSLASQARAALRRELEDRDER